MSTDYDLKLKDRDSVLALCLLLLIAYYFSAWQPLLIALLAVLILGMTVPKLFRPFARCWFALSHVLGKFVSTVIMAVLFYCLVTPTGLIRRAFGWDPMRISQWKKGNDSVFIKRDHRFEPKDLHNPF